MAAAGAITHEQGVWLFHHTLDCCERRIATDEAAEFVVCTLRGSTWVAYVHAGHEPVRWRRWSQWWRGAYPGAQYRRVSSRGRQALLEVPGDA